MLLAPQNKRKRAQGGRHSGGVDAAGGNWKPHTLTCPPLLVPGKAQTCPRGRRGRQLAVIAALEAGNIN